MKNDSAVVQAAIERETLNDYLARWHAWSNPRKINGADHLADPAFQEAETYRGWETEDEIHDREWFKFAMKAIDTIVTGDWQGQGAMESPYKDAILIQARNLHTGFNVWVSNRLPRDSSQRVAILDEARAILLCRMRSAGVLI